MNGHPWQKIWLWGLPVLIFAAFALSAYGVWEYRDQAKNRRLDQCQAINANRKVLRDVLELARLNSDHPNAPFWLQLIAKTQPVKCS